MKSPLKYPGGQHYAAPWIVSHMPPHIHYVEPFAGSLAVLLATDPNGRSEVVNDIDGELMNFWRVLADPLTCTEFIQRASLIPFSQSQWEVGYEGETNSVCRAVQWFVRCRQSYMGAGKSFAAITRSRTRQGMNEQVAAWLSAVDKLPEVAERLRRVLILCDDALNVIRREDSPHTLFYLDPPYYPDTRQPGMYRHEMTAQQHTELLALVTRCKGKVMISGYACELYDRELSTWTRHERTRPNAMQKGEMKDMRTEVLWCNF